MNVKQVDKKRKAPMVAAIVMIIFMLFVIAMVVWGYVVEPIPIIFMALIIAFPVFVIIGTLIALKQRIKEIEGGEEDVASKY